MKNELKKLNVFFKKQYYSSYFHEFEILIRINFSEKRNLSNEIEIIMDLSWNKNHQFIFEE
jgi:hypothetical protein